MKLSILIPTLPERKKYLNELLKNLRGQIGDSKDVKIVIDDRGREVTTGTKRNDLISRATGDYVWQVDDDDYIYPDSISRILAAIEMKPDVIGINGYITTRGKDRVDFEIRLGNPYEAIERDGKPVYLRYPNHITPMKREFALMFKFPDVTWGEDYAWATELHNSGVLKTQIIIEPTIYHYRYARA
jgi:glycosyltransferase involved in cell wall biosynthesis